MKKGAFINVSKRMVREYHNRYMVNEDIQKTFARDVEVIEFQEDSDKYKILMVVPNYPDIFYGVTYDIVNDKLHSYIYNNDGFRVIGRRERMNGKSV